MIPTPGRFRGTVIPRNGAYDRRRLGTRCRLHRHEERLRSVFGGAGLLVSRWLYPVYVRDLYLIKKAIIGWVRTKLSRESMLIVIGLYLILAMRQRFSIRRTTMKMKVVMNHPFDRRIAEVGVLKQ